MNGYLHPLYGESLVEFGTLVSLPTAGGWLLKRPIAQSNSWDAMGPYPLFCCSNWSALPEELGKLSAELVSVALVADPFMDVKVQELQAMFDYVIPYKDHYLVHLGPRPESFISKHHQYYSRRAFRELVIEHLSNPTEIHKEWSGLYKELTIRHNLSGIKAFSENCFEKQLRVPGMVAFTARYHGELVGAHLWYLHGGVAYSHLAATDRLGYQKGASYGLYWKAIQYFKGLAHTLDIGGSAGSAGNSGGLDWFKRGWANGSRMAHFCGKILNSGEYKFLSRRAPDGIAYFPAYRIGELT